MSDHRVDYQIDLQELIETYIWKEYKKQLGFPWGLLIRRSNYVIDVRWGYVDFKHETKYTERQRRENPDHLNVQLYCTQYKNKTDNDQSYNFSTSRETTAATSIELQENYTIGAETNVEVDLGGLVKFGGGINGSFSVTDTRGEQYSETLSWNIDTDITVPANKMATASFNVVEKPVVVDFVTTSTLSLPKGDLPVSIRRAKDKKEVKKYWIQNMECLFPKEVREKYGVKLDEVTDEKTNTIDTIVILTTRGTCRNVSWSNQHVEVEYGELTSSPKKESLLEAANQESDTTNKE